MIYRNSQVPSTHTSCRPKVATHFFASYPAGTVIASHRHDTENVGIITKGSLLLTMDDKKTRFHVDEWYHVPANAEHAAEFEDESSEIEFWFYP